MSSVSEQRQALIALNGLARRDLLALWASLAGLSAEATRDALIAFLPGLGAAYGAAAAALAADWFDELREEEAVPGRFRAEPVGEVEEQRWVSLAGWATTPLFAAAAKGVPADRPAALTLVSGGLQRTVADRHRLTVVENAGRDPQAKGWRRVGVGDNCGFCRMLIDRGHVYTERSVTFRSHDHCNCAAAPSWAENVVKVSPEPFRQSRTVRSDERKARDNARARAYIADRYGTTP